MRDHLDELIANYPRLMHGCGPTIPGYIGAGWHLIVMDLFRRINDLLDDAEAGALRVVQIKEKFGSLRVYVDLAGHYDLVGDIHQPGDVLTVTVPGSNDDTPRPRKLDVIQGYIAEAAALAKATCEVCGASGQRRPGGWVLALCDQHAAERAAGRLDDGS